MLADVRLVDGNAARCVEDLLRAGGGAELPGISPLIRPTCFEMLVRAELERGHRTQAHEWARRAAADADTVGLPGQLGMARLARAEVLLGEDAGGSADSAAAAAVGFAELGDRLREGRARLLLGQAYAEAGYRDDAVRELDSARAMFIEAGARRMHAATVRKLRRLGRRIPSPRAVPGVPLGELGLTARERDVAALVMRGYSNRDIAEELVLSIRTVTTHVSHIFAKLGVSSRAGIACVLVRATQTG